MQFPAIDDTIIAASSGWEARPLGIVRLSGPESLALVQSLGPTPPEPPADRQPTWTEGRLTLAKDVRLPATICWFHNPRSYTGQELAELHTAGCLPLLRELCARLIERGARRALPGEFTARAYLAGKLKADQVEDILALINADSQAAARQTLRQRRATTEELTSSLRQRLLDLLSLVEAGIDFAEEEDVRFITPAEARAALDELLGTLVKLRQDDRHAQHAGKPHVALVGLPNAGKSTLFNALAGYERAIVSPVLGTTRDVLSAEVDLAGQAVILQDCAGLGETADELELASHLVAERTADQADLVLWVHAVDVPWAKRETQAVRRVSPQRRLIVWSKNDLARPADGRSVPGGSPAAVSVSAATGAGLPDLREAMHRLLLSRAGMVSGAVDEEHWRTAAAALKRARVVVQGDADDVACPELLALELRDGLDELSAIGGEWTAEEVLGRVFSQFCVGK